MTKPTVPQHTDFSKEELDRQVEEAVRKIEAEKVQNEGPKEEKLSIQTENNLR